MDRQLGLLADVRIVAFTTFLIGPAATQYLADMGADVVKVEEPHHGPHERHWSGAGTFLNDVSVFFLMSNRNVRSVGLDLKHPDGRQAAIDLCRTADVVVTNFRPGVMERLGLGWEDLRAVKPDLIWACASGYGSDSPYRDLPGQDLLVQSISGLPSVSGRAGGPPVAAGAAIVDQHSATLLALGILGAIHHRDVTGEGQRVEVTMVQAALDLQAEALSYHLNGEGLRRPSSGLATSYHEGPYGFYEVADGHVALSMSPVRLISEALGEPVSLRQLLDPADAFARREEIYDALAPLLRPHSRADLVELLRARGVWCAQLNSWDEMPRDPVVAHLDPIKVIDDPQAGEVRVVGHPISFSSGEPSLRRAPALGEHTEEVLAAAGYDENALARLRDERVVA
ncbi:CaiB/BaiF CoA-transferase family protein [Conexibacter stalactiti]|uniref:CaiB/BaiF CoA-transferase family protein n=1 Tax=Conexibacter stalactiti TaxID=1940611 RepID=A0ABU4HVR0_9ACTN|nr:CaiB/BaiF CoA-transferase family protein [Conexibacter stalactiti]MDW5597421.1 CaiB/BaiF CoA-transferase family protein [Conexibacter stalactiti]MEC5038063.1 CaiB/BaiF CoA-transferase family protein [Conexibacter stalactiti]